jgi:hypothetical protein
VALAKNGTEAGNACRKTIYPLRRLISKSLSTPLKDAQPDEHKFTKWELEGKVSKSPTPFVIRATDET